MPANATGDVSADARAAPPASAGGNELEKLFTEVGGKPDTVTAIMKALQTNLRFGTDVTIKQFYRYMACQEGGVGRFFREMGDTDPDWKSNGPIMFVLDQAYAAAKEIEDRQQKLDRVGSDDEASPINPELNRSLTETWKKKYGFDLHPSQECSGRKLHSLWKRLKIRKGSADQIKGLWTKESDIYRDNAPRRQKESIGNNFSIVNNEKTVDADAPHFNA